MLDKAKEKLKKAYSWLKTKTKELVIALLVLSGIAGGVQYMNVGTSTIQTIEEANLIAHWSFEDATSTKATDFTGNGHTGTLTNMTSEDWVYGKSGTALHFDGSNDYVCVSDNAALARS